MILCVLVRRERGEARRMDEVNRPGLRLYALVNSGEKRDVYVRLAVSLSSGGGSFSGETEREMRRMMNERT